MAGTTRQKGKRAVPIEPPPPKKQVKVRKKKDPSKVKKGEKKTECIDMTGIDYIRCPLCDKFKKGDSTNFFKGNGDLFRNNINERMCYCKECLGNLFCDRVNRYHSELKALHYVCRIMDVYVDVDLFTPYLVQAKQGSISYATAFGKYLTKMGLTQYNGLTYEDSKPLTEKTVLEQVAGGKVVDHNLTRKWGKRYSEDDILFLEEHYAIWDEKVDLAKIEVEKLVIMICKLELQYENAEPGGKLEEGIEKRLLTLMDKANLTPRSMTKINSSDSARVFGVWIRDIENNRPAEFFQDKKLYEDYDGLLDYFKRFILRPLKNILTGSRDFDEEYNIEVDETFLPNVDDEDEYADLDIKDEDIECEMHILDNEKDLDCKVGDS